MVKPEESCDWPLCCRASSVIIRTGRAVLGVCSEHLELLASAHEAPGLIGRGTVQSLCRVDGKGVLIGGGDDD